MRAPSAGPVRGVSNHSASAPTTPAVSAVPPSSQVAVTS
jgi:hypothetical protein